MIHKTSKNYHYNVVHNHNFGQEYRYWDDIKIRYAGGKSLKLKVLYLLDISEQEGLRNFWPHSIKEKMEKAFDLTSKDHRLDFTFRMPLDEMRIKSSNKLFSVEFTAIPVLFSEGAEVMRGAIKRS